MFRGALNTRNKTPDGQPVLTGRPPGPQGVGPRGTRRTSAPTDVPVQSREMVQVVVGMVAQGGKGGANRPQGLEGAHGR